MSLSAREKCTWKTALCSGLDGLLQELSQEETWAYYSKLLKDLLTVCQLASVRRWPQLQEFLQAFAKQRPGSVARSAMHLLISGVLL